MQSGQLISNKEAEIRYRAKISQQHLKGTNYFPHERNQPEVVTFLKERLKMSKSDFDFLSKKNLDFTPFLEIGAEKCQHSSYLQTRFNAKGIALDISSDSLKAAPKIIKKLGLRKIPERVAADAESLPFKNNSFNFVFAYQTLHHFKNLQRLISEVKRVLKPGGYFFFSEEPVKQDINLKLWRRPTKLRRFEILLKYIGILPFLSRPGGTEVPIGILEEFPTLKKWLKYLDEFDWVQAEIAPWPWGPKSSMVKKDNLWIRNNFLITKIMIAVTGGGIKALLGSNEPQGTKIAKKFKGNLGTFNVDSFLACPNCIFKNAQRILERSPLKKRGLNYQCMNCRETYTVRSGVIFLYNPSLMKQITGNRNG